MFVGSFDSLVVYNILLVLKEEDIPCEFVVYFILSPFHIKCRFRKKFCYKISVVFDFQCKIY